MNDREAIDMMQRCAAEIRQLRNRVDHLEPRAEAYTTIRQILDLQPTRGQGYSEDLVWRLEKRIKEMQTDLTELETPDAKS